MTLSLSQSATAIAASLTASFLASSGTAPYTYVVIPGGAGGTVNPSTGVYTAPATASSSAATQYDQVRVYDSAVAPANVTTRILVGLPIFLFCEVIQRELGLADGRVYVWDQKINQPTDAGLYVAVSVPICRPFSNINGFIGTSGMGGNLRQSQSVNMHAVVDIDIISRGPEARDRKEQVILALNSAYAQYQQEANSFYIGKLPLSGGFRNLSEVDGAAIPYRYRISVAMQYMVTKTSAVPYFDTYSQTQTLDP